MEVSNGVKILVIGSGGREHAIVWKLAQSGSVDKIYCAPGNGGIAQVAECVEIKADDVDKLTEFAVKKRIDLTVVGPEVPLAKGIADKFNSKGLRIFGPAKEAARIESSKVFMKMLMRKIEVPTAEFEIFDNSTEAKEYIKGLKGKFVIKTEGLAGGKGAVVCQTKEEGIKNIKSIMDEKIFGDAGNRVIIEECLEGEEASIIVVTDGEDIVPLASSQDHKRVYDGDKGPNCYSEDTEILTKEGWKRFNKLEKDDEVVVYEPHSRKIFFEKPQKTYWLKHKGTMIHFKNRNVDLLVTPNHRMLLQQRYRKKKIYIREASKYKTENYIFQAGIWKEKNPKYFILPEYDYNFNRKFKKLKIDFVDWARFLAIYLSEGFVSKRKGSKRVYIAQSKKSKNFKKIKKIISKLPFNFSYESKSHKFRINSTQLATYLVRFGISYEKYIPNYIRQAKKEVIKEFLKAFNLGDGDLHHGKMRFFSSSKRLIDEIQELIIKLDCSGVITVDRRKTMVNPINKKTYKARPIYSIEIKNRNKTSIRKNNVRTIRYEGNVGCVTVSTGFVVVRRNNRVAISGNTGGMGAYSPAPIISSKILDEIMKDIIIPTIDGLRSEEVPYKGVLYAGIMMTNLGPKVLEFNCRFGDPETQAIFPRLKSDLAELIDASIDEEVDAISLEWDERPCVSVVIASGGYPGVYKTGFEIDGLGAFEKLKDIFVFHAGTKAVDDKIVTSGGRVLNVTALGRDIKEAIDRCYEAVNLIHFEGMHFRRDIGYRALEK